MNKPLAAFLLPLCVYAADSRPSLAEPSISPVKQEIAFVSGGDIWSVPLQGGEAHLLVSHPANESRPLWSPDGARLAFVSTRTGGGDIYVLTLSTGELKRITFDDGPENLSAWSRDGKWLYYHATKQVQLADVYRVSSTGGQPMEISADQMMSEFHAAPSPDGTAVAIAARGNGWNQWWRHGHSHLDESEIVLWRDATPPAYERVVGPGAKNFWPMWSPDGKTIYFVSDRGGQENLWAVEKGQPRQLTRFTSGRVLWPAIAYDGRTIVFERDFRIWQYDVKANRAAEVPITLRGASASAAPTRLPITSFTSLALSPDGRKVALLAHGEVWAASAKDGGEAERVTRTPAVESSLVWAPDSKRVAYLSDRNGNAHVFLYDFTARAEKQLTSAALNDAAPRFSPDGKQIAFIRDRKELHLLTIEGVQDKVLASGPITGGLAWSADGQWIAYSPAGERSFRNVWVVPAAGGEARQLTFLANGFVSEPHWSPDGRYLYFSTSQRTEQTAIARVELTPKMAKFREDQFRDLFKDEPRPAAAPKPEGAKPAAAAKPETPKTPVEIAFEGLKRRLSFVETGLDASASAISPDGKWLLLSARVGGQSNFYLWNLDELARERPVARQLTSTATPKSSPQFSPDSKEVWFLESGRVAAINVDNRQQRTVQVNAEMEVDFDLEKVEVFRQAWGITRDTFYDDKFHGADWNAVRAALEPQIAGARTPDELRRLISLMLGELNASHLGISAPQAGPPQQGGAGGVGRLGLRFDRAEYEKNGKLKVADVLPLGPADLAKIKPGDVIEEVDGKAIAADTNLDELLASKTDKRVELKVNGKVVALRSIGTQAENALRYARYVDGRRAYVEKASGGKLGYVHMADMSQESLERLYVDLDTENQTRKGVVIDIRNNNGGFVNAYALDVFTRRPYLRMEPRGMPQGPARSMLGQRSLELPTILVTNQFSLSDAEDFTEGYRTMKLGKVVGEPTAGWIIYTGAAQLVDGSSLRTPGTKIFGADGKVMELNPRPVDVSVERPVGETYTEKDIQLDTAVAELLKQIGR
jgi:Tol biopolymer transport system component